MRLGLYSIRDNLAGAFVAGVHVLPHDAVAVRFFGDVASNPETTLHKHIGDHELWKIGILHDDRLEEVSPPEVVITGAAWKAAQMPKPDNGAADDRQISMAGVR